MQKKYFKFHIKILIYNMPTERQRQLREKFRKTSEKDLLVLIPYLKNFEIKTILENGEEKQTLKRKNGDGGLETFTRKDTLAANEEESLTLTPTEIDEELKKLKLYYESFKSEFKADEIHLWEDVVQRFLNHRKDMLINNRAYTDDIMEENSSLYLATKFRFLALTQPKTEEEKESAKKVRAFYKSFEEERPELPNYKDKVRIKSEYRKNEWADSHDDFPNYTSPDELRKDELWDGIVVNLRDPGSEMLRIRMLNLYCFDDQYGDRFPVVLDLPYDQVEWLEGPTEDDLKKLKPYELGTDCHTYGIQTYIPKIQRFYRKDLS